MLNPVKDLVRQFDEDDLSLLVDLQIRRQLEYLVGPEDVSRKEWLVQCVLATHGTGLFREVVARTNLFLLLDPDQLAAKTEELTGRSASLRRYDNAVRLSGLTWGIGAPVVDFVSDQFRIPLSFLPHQELGTPTVESLEPYSPLPPLHPHQEDVRAQVVKRFQDNSGNLLVQMPTGSGKTRTMVEALASHWGRGLGRNCLVWLAHSEELCEQAADSISRVWPERAEAPIRLVRFFGKHEPRAPEIVTSIVVASVQKVYYRMQDESLLVKALQSRTQAVVFDEAHQAPTRTRNMVTEFLTANGAPLVGLSATPGRGLDDHQINENTRLAAMFGGDLVVPTGEGSVLDRLTSEGILARVNHREVETGVQVYPQQRDLNEVGLGFDYSHGILTTLAEDRSRNKLLLEAVEKEISKGRPAILFACSVSHARMLSAALNLRGVKAECVHGEMRQPDRYSAVEDFRSGKIDVLTNFGVLTTGFDAPRTRTVIVARPTTSPVLYAQMIGRALRGPRMGGGAEGWVVNVRDNLDRFGDVTNVYHAFEQFWDQQG